MLGKNDKHRETGRQRHTEIEREILLTVHIQRRKCTDIKHNSHAIIKTHRLHCHSTVITFMDILPFYVSVHIIPEQFKGNIKVNCILYLFPRSLWTTGFDYLNTC